MKYFSGGRGIAVLLLMTVLAAACSRQAAGTGAANTGGAAGGGAPARVVSVHDSNGGLVRLDASDDQRVEAFVQCMVDHGIDMGVDLGTPTPAAPPTVPPSTGPTPSEEEFNQTLKLCDQQVPGVYDPDPSK